MYSSTLSTTNLSVLKTITTTTTTKSHVHGSVIRRRLLSTTTTTLEPFPGRHIRRGGCGFPLWISQEQVPHLFGKHGKNFRAIVKDSGIRSIRALDYLTDIDGMVPIRIEPHAGDNEDESVDKAVEMIENQVYQARLYHKNRDNIVYRIFWIPRFFLEIWKAAHDKVRQESGIIFARLELSSFSAHDKHFRRFSSHGGAIFVKGSKSSIVSYVTKMENNSKTLRRNVRIFESTILWASRHATFRLLGHRGKRIKWIAKSYNLKSIHVFNELAEDQDDDGNYPVLVQGHATNSPDAAVDLAEFFKLLEEDSWKSTLNNPDTKQTVPSSTFSPLSWIQSSFFGQTEDSKSNNNTYSERDHLDEDEDTASLEDFILVNTEHFSDRPLQVANSLRRAGITTLSDFQNALRRRSPTLIRAVENLPALERACDLSPQW